MERLTALDAAFLEAEDADSKVSLAMGVLSIVEGPLPDYPAVLDGIAERLTPVPRFTQVIRRQPFDLSAPKWVDDDNFSVERHVRRIAVPAPATMPRCSVSWPISWRDDSTEIGHSGNAGSSTASSQTGGRS